MRNSLSYLNFAEGDIAAMPEGTLSWIPSVSSLNRRTVKNVTVAGQFQKQSERTKTHPTLCSRCADVVKKYYS